MALKEDKVQVTVTVDGKQAINDLGKLELEAYEAAKEMKQLQLANDEYVKKSAHLERVSARVEDLTGKLENMVGSHKRIADQQEQVGQQITTLEGKYSSLTEEMEYMDTQDPGFAKNKAEAERLSTALEQLRGKQEGLAKTEASYAKNIANTSEKITQLKTESEKLTKETTELTGATGSYAAKAKELDGIKEKIKAQREEMGLTGMTMKQLRTYQQELNRELDNMTYGSKAYGQTRTELQEVSKVINKQKDEVRGLGGIWNSISNEVKGFGILAAGYLGFEFITGQISSMLRGNAKLSDSLADIRKTTGLTAEEVKELNSQLSKIDTRTATSALREIAIVGGQIGIAKDQMVGFVEATDMAVVALGDEFTGGAEEVAKEIGSLQRLFSQTKDMDAGEAISKIGSALNELGAAGSATAPEVAEFAKRMGPLGNLSPQITETLGLGAAFQELGLTAERSASGLTAILSTAAGESAKFASFLDMPIEKFKELINSNPNEAVLTLAEGFKGLEQTEVQEVLTQLGIGSLEATKVMGLLADKTDFVREKQALAADALEKNTSLQEENNVKQTTFAALLDRIGKKMAGLTVSQGFMDFLKGAAENTYKLILFLKTLKALLGEIPRFLKDNQVAIYALITAMIAFNFQTASAYAWLLKEEIALKARTIAQRVAATSTNVLTLATKGLSAAFRANPIGFIVGMLLLLVGALATAYTNSQKVRASVAGLFEVITYLAKSIKENVLNVFKGFAEAIDGLLTLNPAKIKAGIYKSLKSAFTLTPMGALLKVVHGDGSALGDAFMDGYNKKVKSEEKQLPVTKKEVKEAAAKKKKTATPEEDEEKKKKNKANVDKFLADKAKEEAKAKKKKAAADKSAAARKKAAADKAKAAKAAADAAEKEAQRQLEMKRLLEDTELALIKDSLERKRKATQLHYDRQIEDLKANGKHSAEIEKALAAKLALDLDEIEKERKARDRKKKLDDLSGAEELSKESAETEFMKLGLAAKIKDSAILELEAAQWKQQRLWEIEKQGILDRMALIDETDETAAAQRTLMAEKLAQIELAQQTSAAEHTRKIAEAELKLMADKYEAAAAIAQSYGDTMLALMELTGSSAEQMASFQKAVTLFQIMIDTAAAISALTKFSEMNPANAVTGGLAGVAQFATGIARIAANIAKAKSILTAEPPDKPDLKGKVITPAAPTPQFAKGSTTVARKKQSFYFGGETGDRSLGFGDAYGDFAGYVHQKEYVIPSFVRRDPEVANFEAIIESKRNGRRPAPIELERSGTSGTGNAKIEALLEALVSEQRASRQTMQNWPKGLKASIALNEFEQAQTLKKQLNDETQF
jgi:hypothetical protein